MAGGEGCRDERRGSSASEVGTVDGTAKQKTKKESNIHTHTYGEGGRYRDTDLARRGVGVPGGGGWGGNAPREPTRVIA